MGKREQGVKAGCHVTLPLHHLINQEIAALLFFFLTKKSPAECLQTSKSSRPIGKLLVFVQDVVAISPLHEHYVEIGGIRSIVAVTSCYWRASLLHAPSPMSLIVEH